MYYRLHLSVINNYVHIAISLIPSSEIRHTALDSRFHHSPFPGNYNNGSELHMYMYMYVNVLQYVPGFWSLPELKFNNGCLSLFDLYRFETRTHGSTSE